jgi:hypothetical protein
LKLKWYFAQIIKLGEKLQSRKTQFSFEQVFLVFPYLIKVILLLGQKYFLVIKTVMAQITIFSTSKCKTG